MTKTKTLLNLVLQLVTAMLFFPLVFMLSTGLVAFGLPLLLDYLSGQTVTTVNGTTEDLAEASRRFRVSSIAVSIPFAGIGSWFFHVRGHHNEARWWLWFFIALLLIWFTLPLESLQVPE